MEFTKKVRNLKRKLPALRHRLVEQGRRLCAVVICASLVIGGFPGAFFQALAADDSEEYAYEFDGISMLDAINTAVKDGTTLDNELVFLGDHADEYAELFSTDGTLYELKDLEPDEDAERDKDSGLRVFVRLEGDIELDEAYEIDGTEEVLFLLTNKTDTDNYIQIIVDDGETDYIQVPAAKDIHVEMDEDLAAAISAAAGGAGGAAIGNGIVIEPVSSDEAENTDIDEDSEVSIEDITIEDETDGTADAEDVDTEDANADEGSEKDSDKAADDPFSDESSDKADSGDTSDDKDASSDNDSSDEDLSDKNTSDDKDSADKDSADKESADKDSSNDKDSSDSNDSSDDNASAENDGSSHHRGSSRGKDSSADKDSSDSSSSDKADSGEKSASISINRTQVLAAAIASASDSDAEDASPSDASPSDASYVIEGTVYDPVRLGRWGAVAFGTTTGDLGLDKYDETLSITYEGDDYTITVEYARDAALPEDVILTGEEYDKDSDTFIERYEEAREFYGWEEGKEPSARLFDVTLWSGEEEVEPAAAVDVTFTFFSEDEDNGIALLSADAEDNEDETDDATEETETGYKGLKYTITHFGAEETETVDSEIISEAGEQSISFTLESFSDIMVFAYEGSGSGKVVLNLGNGNGSYNFADYTGSNSSGTDLRYTTEDLSDYVINDETGHLFIYLPSDNDLNQDFPILRDEDGPLYTIKIGKAQAYDYKLVGWVNIATGKYYDVSKGTVAADIYLTDENVFYADWVARSYDNGKSSESSEGTLRTDTVSTNGFVTINMFDYNDLFNLYSASLTQNGIDSETWSDSGKLHNTLLGDKETEVENAESFVFNNDGTTAGSGKGMLQFLNNRTAGNTWTGTPKGDAKSYVIDASSTWGVNNPGDPYTDIPGDTILGFLFNKTNSEELAGVNYVGEADGLFWVDDNGYYTYDSAESAACYEQTDKKFYVYNKPQYVYGKSRSCFLPYNSYSPAEQFIDEDHSDKDEYEYSVYDGSIDYWFGMSMEVDFYLPSDTGTIGGNQVNEQDMVFNFSGDDDIMIFVDDDLVLDMSGIHDLSYGSINFSSGEVKIGMSRSNGVIDTTYGSTSKASIKSGNHSLKVFYMERGGWESNLEIQFNVVPLWDYAVGDVQTVIAEKTWVDSDGNKIDPSTLPTVYDSGVEVGLFDVLGPAQEGKIGYTENGTEYTVTYKDDSGITHTYVYDSSGPSLNYDGTPYTSVSDGKVLDNEGYIIAWLEDEKLHIRMDKQTLSKNNGWYYAWELLDADGKYEVLELTENPSYTTSSYEENLSTYQYWSIIGEEEIEEYFGSSSDEPLKIILTEAAQEAEGTLGDTKEAYGYVIVANSDNTVSVKQVKFSQIATLELIGEGVSSSYFGTYGVTSQSEIASLGDGAIWYVEDSGNEEEDVGGGTAEGFYLYCILNGSTFYLALNNSEDGLCVTTDVNSRSEFFYDALGELMIEVPEGGTVRVKISEDGTIDIGEGEEVAAKDDVRLYTLTDTPTSGFTFMAVNQFLPDFTLKKIDSTTEESLSGVSFSLMNEDELYYNGLDENTNEIKWSDILVSIDTDTNGQIIFHYLPDGVYVLTETKAADGYSYLPSAIKISILEGKIIGVEWNDESTEEGIEKYVSTTEDELTITIVNHPGAELPRAGGPGTMLFTLTGILLMSGSVLLYLKWKRRRLLMKT